MVLRGDVRELVDRHGPGAVLQEVARQAAQSLEQHPRAPESVRLRPPEPGAGVYQEIGADPAVYDRGWLHAMFHLGSHAGDARCRACAATLHLDYERGIWAGEHAQGCPVGEETVPWGTGQ